MKKLLTIFLSIISLNLVAQVPQGVGYQGVATDANGIELVNQPISIRASVLSGSATGTIEWEETHATSTDTFGLFALTIGQGANTTNGAQSTFADISWGTNTHFLKIEMDVTGGTNYSFMGTNQMMSVPYALYAESANINYDSISNFLSGDSTFITNVGGGIGGGCDYSWPEGLYGTPITETLSSDYTVPSGKNLYLLGVSNSYGNYALYINNKEIGTYYQNGADISHSYPIILSENDVLSGSTFGSYFTFNGILIDVTTQVTPITETLSSAYTVPSGKNLYLLGVSNSYGNYALYINNKEIGTYYQNGADISHSYPIILSENDVLSGSTFGIYFTFNGYLVDENYFAGCGGGGGSSSSTSSLDSTTIANMIAGAGGGCDFRFPEGINGEGVSTDVTQSNPYSVPTGKRLYLLSWTASAAVINGLFDYIHLHTGVPLILNSGQSVSPEDPNVTSRMNGFLVPENNNVQVISIDVTQSNPYSVPIGKRLYLLNWTGSPAVINGLSDFINLQSGQPLILNSGQSVSPEDPNLTSRMNGYLVDENYFAGCGGGGSSSATSNTINYMPGGFLQNPYDGDFILVEQNIQPSNTFTYVVPSGKNLMIDGTSGYWSGIMAYLYYNNYPYFNSITNQDLPLEDVPFMEGDSLVFENTGNISQNIIFYGYLMDTDPSIEIVHVDLSSGQTYTVPSGKKLITSDAWSDNCLNINVTFPNGNTSITSNTFPENINFLSPGISISVNYDITQSPNFYYLFGTLIND